jgi:hypothetical protein
MVGICVAFVTDAGTVPKRPLHNSACLVSIEFQSN